MCFAAKMYTVYVDIRTSVSVSSICRDSHTMREGVLGERQGCSGLYLSMKVDTTIITSGMLHHPGEPE